MTKKIEEFDEEFDDSDLGYDRWVEGIICSDDFEKCEMIPNTKSRARRRCAGQGVGISRSVRWARREYDRQASVL